MPVTGNTYSCIVAEKKVYTVFTMTKVYLAFLIGLVTASLDTFIEKHFSDNPICLVFNEDINYGLFFTQSKILFNVSKHLNEFGSKFVHQRLNYLLIVKDVENLISVVNKLILNHNYNTKQKHLIVVKENLNTKELNSCFSLLWQQNIYNVVITTAENAAFITWHPYGKKASCGKNVVTKTNATAPFSNKIPSRFTNCKVNLIWKKYPVLNTHPKEEPLGVMNKMLLLMGDKIGLRMYFPQEENQLVYDELLHGNITTQLGQYTTKNSVDIVANVYGVVALLYLDKSLELSISLTVHKDMWLLPPKQPLPLIKAFLAALTFQEYLLISISFLSFTFIWRLTSNNYFDVTNIFLQQPIRGGTIKNDAKRLLLICGLFFTVHMGLLYSSQLIRVLYRPVYPPSYKTIEEVLDKTDLKFSYPAHFGKVLKERDVKLWKRIEARTEELLVSKIYTSTERKRRFLHLKGVLDIGSYDLYYVYNPQDLEILEEQVSLLQEGLPYL